MKIVLTIFVFILSTVAFSATISKKKGGFSESYGGDSVIADFKFSTRQVVTKLKEQKIQQYWNIGKDEILEIIDQSNIVCVSNLVLDGVTKNAINYPNEKPQRIELDCDSFRNKTSLNKRLLSVHEFMHLSFIDDSEYKTSWKILDDYNSALFSTDNSEDLLRSVLDCDERLFNDSLENGANINFISPQLFRSPTEFAIKIGCPNLLNQLYKHKAKTLTYKIIYEFNEMVWRIVENNDNDVFVKNAIETLKVVVKNNPDIVNAKLKHGRIKIASFDFNYIYEHLSYSEYLIDFGNSLFNDSAYFINYGECVDTSVMSILAYEIQVTPNDKAKFKVLNQLFSELRKMGFQSSTKNDCKSEENVLINILQ